MKRLFSAYVFLFAVLTLIGTHQQSAHGQGKGMDGRPDVEFVKPNEVQENNTIHWEIKVKARGTTINKVTLDIMPLGGEVTFRNPTPLPSGRGYYKPWDEPTVVDGVFQEEGKSKNLPPGSYFMAVVVTYNGTKTMRSSHLAEVTGDDQPAIGKINEEMEFLPARLLLSNRMKIHGKYRPPDTDYSVKRFAITLFEPGDTVKVKEVESTAIFSHTFDGVPATGRFTGYVRARVFNAADSGNGVGWVYSTHHEKKVP